jgi:hypothetical protein
MAFPDDDMDRLDFFLDRDMDSTIGFLLRLAGSNPCRKYFTRSYLKIKIRVSGKA